jgi:hypothetical protein
VETRCGAGHTGELAAHERQDGVAFAIRELAVLLVDGERGAAVRIQIVSAVVRAVGVTEHVLGERREGRGVIDPGRPQCEIDREPELE